MIITLETLGNTFDKLLKEMEQFYSTEDAQETSLPIDPDISKEKYFAAQLSEKAWHR